MRLVAKICFTLLLIAGLLWPDEALSLFAAKQYRLCPGYTLADGFTAPKGIFKGLESGFSK